MKSVFKMISGVALIAAVASCGTATNETKNEPVNETNVEVTAKADEVNKVILAKGKEIAKATFMALSGKLKTEMKAGGPLQAIPFCSEQAMPLTDSLSHVYGAKVQRVATKFRNPQNEAVGHDIEVMDGYLANMAEGDKLMPQVHTNQDGESVFYAPIILKAQCIVCHGHPESQVKPETLSALAEAYPTDKATGFEEGELRGLWKITFNN